MDTVDYFPVPAALEHLRLPFSEAVRVGSMLYLSGAMGKNYLREALFEQAGIAVAYQQYRHPEYDQGKGRPFEPAMAVIDLLFNCGPRSLEVIMNGQDAVQAPQGTVKNHG